MDDRTRILELEGQVAALHFLMISAIEQLAAMRPGGTIAQIVADPESMTGAVPALPNEETAPITEQYVILMLQAARHGLEDETTGPT